MQTISGCIVFGAALLLHILMIHTVQLFQENCIFSISTAVLDECALACLKEHLCISISIFLHSLLYVYRHIKQGEGVKRDLMLCISCPVYVRLPRYPSTKSQLFSKYCSDQTKQSRNIFRLTIDIQNLSRF